MNAVCFSSLIFCGLALPLDCVREQIFRHFVYPTVALSFHDTFIVIQMFKCNNLNHSTCRYCHFHGFTSNGNGLW